MIFLSDDSSPFPYRTYKRSTTRIRHGLDGTTVLGRTAMVEYCGKSITTLSSGIIIITKQSDKYNLKCESLDYDNHN
jgi:hypothetical protein